MKDSFVSVTEAAKIKKVTRQAIFLAIKTKSLRAFRHGHRYRIYLSDLNEYNKHLYSRFKHSHFEGERIFDETKGYLSVQKAAELIKIPKQKLYYAIRLNLLKSVRKNNQYVIHVDDLFEYHTNLLKSLLTENMA